MEARGRHFLTRNAHLIEEDKILHPPFFSRDKSGKYECLQTQNTFDKHYAVISKVCEENSFAKFENLVLHYHNDHQMSTRQLDWICNSCQWIGTSVSQHQNHSLSCLRRASQSSGSSLAEPLGSHVIKADVHENLPSRNKLSCKICLHSFANAKLLTVHKENQQHFTIEDLIPKKKKLHQCHYCNYQDDDKKKVEQHRAKFHAFKKFEGETDFLTFRVLQNYPKFVCPYKHCQFETRMKSPMLYHFERIHKTAETFDDHLKKYQTSMCPKCRQIFTNCHLKTHLKECKYK